MEEIARFLHTHPPFDQLPFARVLELAKAVQIEYFPAHHAILTQGGAQAQFLYIVCRGGVELVRTTADAERTIDTLGAGEAFGHPSLIRGQPPLVTARTISETLAYLIPAAQFHQLRNSAPAVAQFFAASVIERLGYAVQTRADSAEPALFQTRLRDLVQRTPVLIAPNASVREAAKRMHEQNVSCLVVDQHPIGIITDRDLRNRVLAAGRSPETLVQQVMSAPATAIAAEALVFEGLMLMTERGIHHLPLVDGDKVVGVVTHTDVLRQQQRSPIFLPRLLQRASNTAELRRYTDQVAQTVDSLLDAGARVGDIGRAVAVAHDALLSRLLRDAEAELGPPPCTYAWLVLGSEGRYEQTLRTDQDNALIYADEADADAEAYFARLAERVVNTLVDCGFPRCPGNIMATNPEWRQPLTMWQNHFRRWISIPDEENLLRVGIFFDYRQVHGELDAEAALRPLIAQAPENRVFLGRLARAGLRTLAPLGFFRQVVLERKDGQRNLLDLKLRGTALIVDLARLFALEAGVAATSTTRRLREAAGRSSLDVEGAENLIAAFELLNRIRLRQQMQQLAAHQEPSNTIVFTQLPAREQREIKESLQVIAAIQRSVAFAFQTERIA